MLPHGTYIRRPRTAQPAALLPTRIASAYNFPLGTNAAGYTGGIIELGGGYRDAQLGPYFEHMGIHLPSFTPVSVGRGVNLPGGDADSEVQLDMCVAGAVAPTAAYRVYFAENTDAGFLDAVKAAASECDGVSISWGAPEVAWSRAALASFEQVLHDARARGVPVFVAAGDAGGSDGARGCNVDFPSSSPSSIGCGGTRLLVNPDSSRKSETTWNNDPRTSATGGGVSKAFPARRVPDVAGNADPDTGYVVSINGQNTVVGGTSAVAPLMLGLHALLSSTPGVQTFDMMNLIATNPQACFDVTAGDNGCYRAGPGRDNVTGFGVPDGGKLLAALSSGIPAPAPPASPDGPPAAQPPTFTVAMTGTFVGTFTPEVPAA